MSDTIANLATALMRAVVASGAVRNEPGNDNTDAALRIMHEELKEFIAGSKYENERSIIETGGHQLAFASLIAECVRRLAVESKAAA